MSTFLTDTGFFSPEPSHPTDTFTGYQDLNSSSVLFSFQTSTVQMARLKRRWRNIPPLNRKAIVRRIRNLISRDVERVDINKLLKSVFTKKFDFGMHEMAIDYPHKSAIVNSIARELMDLKRKEHQSGAFRALVSACARGNLPVAELARQLKIHRNTAKKVFILFSIQPQL